MLTDRNTKGAPVIGESDAEVHSKYSTTEGTEAQRGDDGNPRFLEGLAGKKIRKLFCVVYWL